MVVEEGGEAEEEEEEEAPGAVDMVALCAGMQLSLRTTATDERIAWTAGMQM